MNLLLLGPAYQWAMNPSYRGTERRPLGYPDGFPEDSEPVLAWNRLMDHIDTTGDYDIVADLAGDSDPRYLPPVLAAAADRDCQGSSSLCTRRSARIGHLSRL